MSRTCNGDFFTASNVRYYRCTGGRGLAFARIIEDNVCPVCKQKLGRSLNDLGRVDIEILTVVQAILPDGTMAILNQSLTTLPACT